MRLLCLAILALVLTGCGDTDPEGSTSLQPAGAPTEGTRRVTCVVATDHGPARLALDLPPGFIKGLPDDYEPGPDCSWHRPVRVPDDGNFDGDPSTQDTYSSDVVLILEPAGKGHPLREVYDEQRPDAVFGDTPGGDDSILYLKLREGVPTYGETVGDRLSYLCFCDGQNLIDRYAQADGVRLTWSSDLPLQRETDRQLEAILASIGTVA